MISKRLLHVKLSLLRNKFRSLHLRLWLHRRRKYPERTSTKFDIRCLQTRSDTFLPVIVSFGTDDPKYSKCLASLEADVNRIENEVSAVLIARGQPNFARRLKPSFIKLQLLSIRKPVLWLDCDSSIVDKIYLPEGSWDIGTIALAEQKETRVRAADCIAFQPTAQAIKFLELWEYLCLLDRGGGSDHFHMLFAFDLIQKEISEIDIKAYVQTAFLRGKLGESLSKLE